jgi:hypothetical protein
MTVEVLMVLGSILFTGAFFLWAKLWYEPRRDIREAHIARLFDCAMTRQLMEGCSTPEARAHILGEILLRRPALMGYPEWAEVWGDDDPLGRE